MPKKPAVLRLLSVEACPRCRRTREVLLVEGRTQCTECHYGDFQFRWVGALCEEAPDRMDRIVDAMQRSLPRTRFLALMARDMRARSCAMRGDHPTEIRHLECALTRCDARLRTADRITVTLSRNGAPVNLDFNIRQ